MPLPFPKPSGPWFIIAGITGAAFLGYVVHPLIVEPVFMPPRDPLKDKLMRDIEREQKPISSRKYAYDWTRFELPHEETPNTHRLVIDEDTLRRIEQRAILTATGESAEIARLRKLRNLGEYTATYGLDAVGSSVQSNSTVTMRNILGGCYEHVIPRRVLDPSRNRVTYPWPDVPIQQSDKLSL